MAEPSFGFLGLLGKIAEKIWKRRILVIDSSFVAGLLPPETARWSRPENVSAFQAKGYSEFVKRNWIGRATVYKDRSGAILLFKKIK
ncbi:hypothetical protein [Puniceibacterium antarcticum]|uniref:hypothetical protein n=1 Tax=Puniceibacterium antarcticum TaxID=1206336 RepID=UPI001179AC73|nr:hypothetical protein [Puniceibacterium antarcticum]